MMHRSEAGMVSRLCAPVAMALVVATVTVLPMFGGPAYAAGLNLDGTVAHWEFAIPGVPTSTTAGPVPDNQDLPAPLTLADPVAGLFPKSGELLLGKTELVVYDNNNSNGNCAALAANQVCITQRAKVGEKKNHVPGTQVKLATQLTNKIRVPTSGPKTAAISASAGAKTTLTSTITKAAAPPFTIGITNGGNFPNKGYITVSHQATVLGVGSTEYFQYDSNQGNPCSAPKPAVGPSSLCIIARAQQPNNQAYRHPANGFPQPGGTPGVRTSGRSHVDLHFQIEVKSNVGFFPAGNLMVYDVDAGNNIIDAELLGHNAAADKVKTPAANEFHVTQRGGSPSTFKKTDIVQHNVGSIVTGADTFVNCRIGFVQPFPDRQDNPNSVGAFLVCYEQSQPNGPPKPKPAGPLQVPIKGQSWILFNALAQPVLSSGGFTHVLFGPVPEVDTDGTKDGVLNLVSPCIEDFTPGTNLQMEVTLNMDKDHNTPDTGSIRVVVDTIPSTPAHSDCDDPAGTSGIISTAYIFPGDANKSDDDTDGDGCTDDWELIPDPFDGGLRDPWNPYDYYDVNHDGFVNMFVDIMETALARFGATPAGDERFDRGASYGPFDRNRSAPDGTIGIFDDILVVAGQFGNVCPHNHANYAPAGPIQWFFGDHP